MEFTLGRFPPARPAHVMPFALGGERLLLGSTSGATEHYVSAATMAWFYGSCHTYISPIRLSASTGVLVEVLAVRQGHSEILRVAASSSFSVSDAATYRFNTTYSVSASTGFTASSSSSEVADFARAATSGATLTTSASEVRDIACSAITSVGLTLANDTNHRYQLAGLTSVIIAGVAGVFVTGTIASNHLILTDRAQAVVWFPWRRTSLSLSPGGNLPHS